MSHFQISKNLFYIIITLIFVSCASHQTQSLRKIDVGMDKSDVLEKIGNPTRKARVLGQDRWTYEIDGDSGTDTTYIFFQEGRVTYIGGAEEPTDAAIKATKPKGEFKPIGE